jgi:hypothetical protein
MTYLHVLGNGQVKNEKRERWEEMGEIIMRNRNSGELRVQVDSPYPIRQVQVPIWHVITPTQCDPSSIWQVIPLISHICLYPPYCPCLHSHLSLSHPQPYHYCITHSWVIPLYLSLSSWWVDTEYRILRVQHTPSTPYSKYSIHQVQHKPSTVYTKYSIHQVQHTPSTAYTKYSIHQVQHIQSRASNLDCLSSIHFHDYRLTPECSFSFWRASLHDWPPSASCPWEHKGKAILAHAHSCELTNLWKEAHHPARHQSTAAKYSSNLNRSRSPSVSLNSFNYDLQVRTIMGSMCISKHTPSQPCSASLSALNHVFQTHSVAASQARAIMASQLNLQSRSITASKFTRSWPPSASPN